MMWLWAFLIGLVLDFLLGDPEKLPHPVRWIGWWIATVEKGARRVFPKTAIGELCGGFLLVLLVCVPSFGIPYLILEGAKSISPWLHLMLEAWWIYRLLAAKSLYVESMRVLPFLESDDLAGARRAVSRIVGRDTENLSEEGVVRAAVETVAENTSDGVIAPMFYILLGGPALGFLYKAVNTMDSMVGYRNEKYLFFGKCAARLDDVLNFIPARIAGLAMVLAAGLVHLDMRQAWHIFWRDRYQHKSPNSAQTEAACAGALRVQLAGDAIYFGKRVAKPTIGDSLRRIESEDIRRANHLMFAAVLLCAVFFILWKLC